jgi:hypothetical protein
MQDAAVFNRESRRSTLANDAARVGNVRRRPGSFAATDNAVRLICIRNEQAGGGPMAAWFTQRRLKLACLLYGAKL